MLPLVTTSHLHDFYLLALTLLALVIVSRAFANRTGIVSWTCVPHFDFRASHLLKLLPTVLALLS
jgi:hypothetical protein